MSEELKLKISEIFNKKMADYTEEDKKVFKQVDNLKKVLELNEIYNNKRNENREISRENFMYIFENGDIIKKCLPTSLSYLRNFSLGSNDSYIEFKNYIEILTKKNLTNEDIEKIQNIPIYIIFIVNPNYVKYQLNNNKIGANIFFEIKKINKFYFENEVLLKEYGIEKYKDFLLLVISLNKYIVFSQFDESVYNNGNLLDYIYKNVKLDEQDMEEIEKNIYYFYDYMYFEFSNIIEIYCQQKIKNEALTDKIINDQNLISNLPNILDIILENKLTDNIINYALEHGYIITKQTPSKIKNNIDLVKRALNNNDKYDSVEALSYLETDILEKLVDYIHETNQFKLYGNTNSLKIIINKSLSTFLCLISKENYFCDYLKLIPLDILNNDINFTKILKFMLEKESLYELFGTTANKGKYEILKNPELIKQLLNQNFNLNLIDYVSDDILNDNLDIVDLVLDKGYKLNEKSPSIIKKDINFIRKLIERENDPQIYAIDYMEEKFLTEEIINLVIDKGYRLNEKSPSIIKKDINYIEKLIERENNPDIYLIESIDEEILKLNLYLIDLAIEKGYELSYASPNIIKNDIEYIRKLIKRENNPQINAIDFMEEKFLTEEIINLVIDKGYKLNKKSPSIIKKDINYIGKLIERKENPQIDVFNYFNVIIDNENKKIISEMLEKAIDLGYSNIGKIEFYFEQFDELEWQKKSFKKLGASIITYYSYSNANLDNLLYKSFIEEFFYNQKIEEEKIDDFFKLLNFRCKNFTNLKQNFEWNILKYLDLKDILEEFNKASQTKINIDVDKITNLFLTDSPYIVDLNNLIENNNLNNFFIFI